MKKLSKKVTSFGHPQPNPVSSRTIIFHSVGSNANVVKGEFQKDGQKHTVYLLAIPEDKISDYSYKDNLESQLEHAED